MEPEPFRNPRPDVDPTLRPDSRIPRPDLEVIREPLPPNRRQRRREQEDILGGALWMVGITLLLFFLPVINGFVGGLVGGYKVGDVRRALLAALLPAVVVGVGLWFILAVLGLPVVGLIAGVAAGGWVVLSEFGLFAGAMVGGALGGMRKDGTRRA